MTTARTSLLFRSAAIFNVLAGLPMLFAGGLISELFGIADPQASLVFVQLTGLAIIGFGWGYWEVARDPVRNRMIAVLGMALKIGFVAIAVGNWLAGTINAFLPLLAVGDVIYTGLFWMYLRSSDSAQPQS